MAFRVAMVAGKPMMGFPVAAWTSGIRGETPMLRVEFWIRAISFRVLSNQMVKVTSGSSENELKQT